MVINRSFRDCEVVFSYTTLSDLISYLVRDLSQERQNDQGRIARSKFTGYFVKITFSFFCYLCKIMIHTIVWWSKNGEGSRDFLISRSAAQGDRVSLPVPINLKKL